MAHAGQAEAAVAGASTRGLHGPRLSDRVEAQRGIPLRYVLAVGALAGVDRAASRSMTASWVRMTLPTNGEATRQ
jgi:hypothetical protein